MVTIIERFENAKRAFYAWSDNLSVAKKLIACFVMASIVGLLAQIRVYLPWTPVPIVGSGLGVIISGVILGGSWGAVSMLIYALLGFAGMPWFAGFRGGPEVLFGPTAGYIIGFIFAAAFVGYLTRKLGKSRSFTKILLIVAVANFILIYIPGLIWLKRWFLFSCHRALSIKELLFLGALPFVPGDIVKVFLASMLAFALKPNDEGKSRGPRIPGYRGG